MVTDSTEAGTAPATAIIAGPPRPSPPLGVALWIIALGFAGPVVFVRTAVPSLFLTLTTLILPIAGLLALYGWLQSARQRRADRASRVRAEIAPDGIALLPRPEMRRVYGYGYDEIAGVSVTRSELVLHLRGEKGKRRRHVLRYAGIETAPEAFGAAAEAALARHRGTESGPGSGPEGTDAAPENAISD